MHCRIRQFVGFQDLARPDGMPSALSRLTSRFRLPPLAERIVNCRLSRRFALSGAHLRPTPSLRVDEAPRTQPSTLSGKLERLTITVGRDALVARLGLDLESCGDEQLKARNSLGSRRLTIHAASRRTPNRKSSCDRALGRILRKQRCRDSR